MSSALKKKTCLFILIVSLLALLPQALSVRAVLGERAISGVYFQEYHLGGMSYDAFAGIIEAEAKRINGQFVYVHIPEMEEMQRMTYHDFGISIDREKIWQEAVSVGRKENWWRNLATRLGVSRKGHRVPLYLTIDKKRAKEQVKTIAGPWLRAPRDAQLVISRNDKIEIVPHEDGKEADEEGFCSSLDKECAQNPGKPLHIILALRTVKAGLQKSDIEAYGIKGLVSQSVTEFDPEKTKRTKNLEKAAEKLDYCLLAPGEIFSFNEAVGPRTQEEGYYEADIIYQNQLVPGIGGGVCQVSTTLYNAALLAELEILERSPHSKIVSYVAPGLDATVVYGSRDLKFRNNSGGCLILRSYVDRGTLTVKIYGTPCPMRRIELRSFVENAIPPPTVYREDESVPQGTYILEREGEPGYEVRAERRVYNGAGELIETEIISRDRYPPTARVIKTSRFRELLSKEGVL